MTNKKRRCLKFVGYIFIPTVEELENKKIAKYFIIHQPGRIQFYDEHGKKVDSKMEAFDTIGDMAHRIQKHLAKMFKGRFK